MGTSKTRTALAALVLTTLSAAQSTQRDPADLAALTTAWESSQHADSDLAFYRTPSNFSSDLDPGSVLKIEHGTNLTNYTVPSSISMSRIMYTTEDLNGTVVPASAYVLWPYNVLPSNDTAGYPVVLWAHGTTGLFEPCAPSNYRSLQYHFMVPYLLAMQGIVVVAPDYAGLGVGSLANGDRIRHQWATSPAQANDKAYALIAARHAFAQELAPGGPFVAMGYSQGGLAAWSYAERQALKPLAGYRGTATFAPAADAIAQLDEAPTNSTEAWIFTALQLQPMLIDAVTTVYPAYNRSGMTDLTRGVFDSVYEPSGGCLPTQNVLFGVLPPDQLVRPGWTNNSYVRDWQKRTAIGRKKFAGPMLVMHGSEDSTIPYNDTVSASVLSTVQDTCKAMEDEGWNASLELVGYLGEDHFPVIQASQSRWLAWVTERLSPFTPAAPVGCAIGEVGGSRAEYAAKSGPLPNFLVDWANATNVWQYAL